jgi:hypothetical protein
MQGIRGAVPRRCGSRRHMDVAMTKIERLLHDELLGSGGCIQV